MFETLTYDNITLGFVGFAILLILLALPLRLNKIKPNWLYGLRTPTTVNNPDIWYAINRHTAKQMIWFAITLIVVAIVLDQYAALSTNLFIGINAGLAVIGISYIAINGIQKARKLAAK